MSAFVKETGADIGLAFDGDGDRLIAIDHEGTTVDGDQIMFICAKYLHEHDLLKNDTVVSTVMSNLGFYKALEASGIQSIQTQVGDRYVMEGMREGGYVLGGEQSGHIIFLEHVTTGDGMLSAIQLVNIMKKTGKSLQELASEMTKYPQVLKNVRVTDKKAVFENERVQQKIEEVEQKMAGNGRVLVRPSGTEPLVRVMAEAETESLCEAYVDEIVAVVEEELGAKA